MKKYVAIIGSMDDFNTHNDLVEYFQSGKTILNGEPFVPLSALDHPNFAEYQLEIPEGFSSEHIDLIACGKFFQNDWCMDWTFSQIMAME